MVQMLRATGKPYHPRCFTCVVCGKNLDGLTFTVDATNQIHCIDDFHRYGYYILFAGVFRYSVIVRYSLIVGGKITGTAVGQLIH